MYGTTYPVTKAWKRKRDIELDAVVEIKENMEIGLIYTTDTKVWDNQASLSLEVTMEDRKEVTIPLQHTTSPVWLFRLGEVYPWRTGYYLITFTYLGTVYYSAFSVTPLHFTSQQLKQLHHYLEQKVTGVIQDSLPCGYFQSGNGGEWYTQYAQMVHDHYQEIGYFLQLLSKKTVTTIVGMNEISLRPGRMNKKSMQWQLTNEAIGTQTRFSNKVKKEVTDTPENRWMKTILVSWLQELEEVERHLQTQGNHYDKAAFSSLKHRIMYMAYKSFLSQLPLGNKKPLLKRPAYHKISTYYDKLKGVYLQRQQYEVASYQRLKKTWQLYEYYCLFVVLDALKLAGYTYTNSMSQSIFHSFQGQGIPEGTCFEVEKEKQLIRIWYDKEIVASKNEALSRGEEIYCLSGQKRPDIRMDYYHRDTKEYQYTIVMDAKFRRLQNIRIEGGTSDTQLQLFSYWQMVHVQAVRPTVANVICLYANDGLEGTKEMDQTITYLKLFPQMATGNVIGLEELVNMI